MLIGKQDNRHVVIFLDSEPQRILTRDRPLNNNSLYSFRYNFLICFLYIYIYVFLFAVFAHVFGLIAQNGVLFVYVIGMCMVIKICRDISNDTAELANII